MPFNKRNPELGMFPLILTVLNRDLVPPRLRTLDPEP